MSANPWKRVALWLVAASFAVLSVGCGSKPPCETDLSAVDSARSDAASAERELEDAKAQKTRLEQQIADEERRRKELEKQRAELLTQIDELGG